MPTATTKTESTLRRKSYADYSYSQGPIKHLIDEFGSIQKAVDYNRVLRYVKNNDTDALRAAGKLKEDELYIPVRLIDQNVRREQAQYIAYFTQSRRSIVFNSVSGLGQPGMESLEIDFTNKARYIGWEIPFIRCIDGCQAHGWDAIEIVFDTSMPGQFALEHVGTANLIFNTESENLQAQEMIIRAIKVTALQLRQFVDEQAFDEQETNEFLSSATRTNSTINDSIQTIYKVFYKEDGVVWYGFYAPMAKGWLRKPVKLYLGRHDVTVSPKVIVDEQGQESKEYPIIYETDYPVYLLEYIQSEDPKITELQGRAALDEKPQEGASAIMSGMVNGVVRAANVYAAPLASPANANPMASPKQTTGVLRNGIIYDQAMQFFHTPYPEASTPTILQAVVSQNQQESSQINYTVMARKDSGKSATEVNAAQQEAQKLSTVQVTLLSIFIRSVYSRCWQIYQNRVLQDAIVTDDVVKALMGRFDAIAKTWTVAVYVVKSSGDVDVVQRAEKLQRQMNFWPVVSASPIASLFLEDTLRNAFPEDAEKYVQMLKSTEQQQKQQQTQLVAKLAALVKELAIDPATKQLRPELAGQEQQLQQLEQEVAAIAGSGQQQQQA